MGPSTRLPRVQQSSRQTCWRLHPKPSYGRPIPTLVSAMILTPTLPSLASSAFLDNLAEFPCGYFCEIGLNSDRSVLASLRSSLHTGNIFFFFEYIRKIHSLPSRLVTFKCILSHCDRARSSRERGLQALPRLSFMAFSSGFFFLFCIFCYHSLLGEWSAVQLPAKASDGLSASDLFLAAQLPATVSDGLSSSVSFFISPAI